MSAQWVDMFAPENRIYLLGTDDILDYSSPGARGKLVPVTGGSHSTVFGGNVHRTIRVLLRAYNFIEIPPEGPWDNYEYEPILEEPTPWFNRIIYGMRSTVISTDTGTHTYEEEYEIPQVYTGTELFFTGVEYTDWYPDDWSQPDTLTVTRFDLLTAPVSPPAFWTNNRLTLEVPL